MEKKRAVPGYVQVEVAIRLGVPPGGTAEIRCYYCGRRGEAHWMTCHIGTSRERPAARVGFTIREGGRGEAMELDHFLPRSRGGRTAAENLVVACRRCNRSKGAKDAPKARP